MIQKVLKFTAEALDDFLKKQFGLSESKVILNKVVSVDGKIPSKNQNKVVTSLINVNLETLKPFQQRPRKIPNDKYSDILPTNRINLEILMSSNFDDYDESLKFLDSTIIFFQMNPTFDRHNFPSMPIGIERIQVELQKTDYTQMQHVWKAMGTNYCPSVIYTFWLVSNNSPEVTGFDAAITSTKALPDE